MKQLRKEGEITVIFRPQGDIVFLTYEFLLVSQQCPTREYNCINMFFWSMVMLILALNQGTHMTENETEDTVPEMGLGITSEA